MMDVLVVKDEAVQVVSDRAASPLVVGGAVRPNMVVSPSTPGPAGTNGVDGADSGSATYISENEPIGAVDRETWFNPTTHAWRVRHNDTWQPLYADGGFF